MDYYEWIELCLIRLSEKIRIAERQISRPKQLKQQSKLRSRSANLYIH